MSVRDFIRENNPKTIRDPNFNGKNLPNAYMTPCSDDTFQNFYYWDTYFINVGLLANNDIEMARNNLKIMEYFASKHGFIPNADHLLYGSQPPLFTRGVYDLYMKTRDINDILYFVDAIEKELNFWEENRQTEIGLNQYKCAWPDELCKENASYFNNRVNGFNEIELQEGDIEMAKSCYAIAESGMDINSKYYSKGNRFAIQKFACLDLNCLLYDAEKKFAEMLRIIKNDAKAEHFEQKAEKRKKLINKYFLKDGLYYDYNFVDKEHSFLLTAASLYPYTFGISSDKEGAKKVFNLLRQKYGLTSTVDFESENKLQWDFPSVWPPLVYFEYIAFKNLNMQEEADFVAKTYKNNVEYNYEKTGKIWEKYNALTNEVSYSFEYQTPTMLGWSAGIYEYFCEEGY